MDIIIIYNYIRLLLYYWKWLEIKVKPGKTMGITRIIVRETVSLCLLRAQFRTPMKPPVYHRVLSFWGVIGASNSVHHYAVRRKSLGTVFSVWNEAIQRQLLSLSIISRGSYWRSRDSAPENRHFLANGAAHRSRALRW